MIWFSSTCAAWCSVVVELELFLQSSHLIGRYQLAPQPMIDSWVRREPACGLPRELLASGPSRRLLLPAPCTLYPGIASKKWTVR